MNSRYIVIFVAIATISTIGAYTYNEAMASHAFEGGTAGGALPIATTVIISGEVMQSGDYMPLVDFSPNFVAGHLLLRIPCDAEGIPRVFPVAGHIDEMAHRTYTSQPQMNLIEHVSNKGKTCVYHSHVLAIYVHGFPVICSTFPFLCTSTLSISPNFGIVGPSVLYGLGRSPSGP